MMQLRFVANSLQLLRLRYHNLHCSSRWYGLNLLRREPKLCFFSACRLETSNLHTNLNDFLGVNYNSTVFRRLKSVDRKRRAKANEEDAREDANSWNDEDESLKRDSKVVTFNVTSMRTDLILKSSLNIARNKIETLFYESKIRVNGQKIFKKSASVREGDEIDIIKAASPKSSDLIYVSRVEVLEITPKEESIQVTTRRYKTLLIENYKDPFTSSSQDES